MKKGFYAILAALTVFALVMTGCPPDGGDGPSGGGDDITITFSLNGGPGTPPAAATIKKAATLGDKMPGTLEGGRYSGKVYSFKGWFDAATAGTAVTSATTFNDSATVYAQWTTIDIPAGNEDKVLVLVNFNWPIGTTPDATDIWVDKNAAIGSGLVAPTAVQTPAGYEFEAWNSKADGTGSPVTTATTVSTDDINIYAKWEKILTVSFNSAGGTAVASIKAKSGATITAPTAPTKTADADGSTYTFIAWYKEAAHNNPWVFATATVTEDVTLYAEWAWNPVSSFGAMERVTLGNAGQVIYHFELPGGKTWSDYNGISADYMLQTDAEFDVENSARTIRVYGNYEVDFFQFNTTAAGSKFAYASLDGNANNNEYILENGKGGWKTLGAALTDELPGGFGLTLPSGKEWFTLSYPIDGSNANVKPHKHLPAAGATGPFIFGLGLAGAGDKNTFYIKNVKLLGIDDDDTVLGKALYITNTVATVDTAAYDYPAFSAYGTDAGNGVDTVTRITYNASDKKTVAAVERPKYTITFDLNDSTLTDAAFVDTAFAGTMEVEKYGALAAFPLVTPAKSVSTLADPDKRVVGWGLTASTDAANKIALNHPFSANTTVYAIWGANIPDATADLVITPKIHSFGGLGSLNEDAGYGPFDFNTSQSNDAAIWFSLTDAVTTANYKQVKIEFTAVKTGTIDKVRKVTFHLGRADNSWSGGSAQYEDISADSAQEKTYALNDLTIEKGIVIQHNKYGSETCDFDFTITKITLIKP